jgi:HD-GYP domain-containing protein (c-di-GMP phosphodiesterase class II)
LYLPNERLQVLERAAILHDIGKIGIDMSLSHKEGKLTPGDIRELQRHPAIGMNILEPLDFLQEVSNCIGQHHERFDGMGYPNQVKKDEQLVESRILGVADAFDAMTSNRPYRKALTLENAINELHDNAGTQFDPEIVDIFVQLIQDGNFSGFQPSGHPSYGSADVAPV